MLSTVPLDKDWPPNGGGGSFPGGSSNLMASVLIVSTNIFIKMNLSWSSCHD